MPTIRLCPSHCFLSALITRRAIGFAKRPIERSQRPRSSKTSRRNRVTDPEYNTCHRYVSRFRVGRVGDGGDPTIREDGNDFRDRDSGNRASWKRFLLSGQTPAVRGFSAFQLFLRVSVVSERDPQLREPSRQRRRTIRGPMVHTTV